MVEGAVYVTVLYLEPRPGDRIELLGAEPIGVESGADVRFCVSRSVLLEDGDRVVGEQREPPPGAIVETDAEASLDTDDIVGIVADRPGRYELVSVRLRYRINGGSERSARGST